MSIFDHFGPFLDHFLTVLRPIYRDFGIKRGPKMLYPETMAHDPLPMNSFVIVKE